MDHELAELIKAAMAAADRSQRWTADRAGISITTFRRKLRDGAPFTVAEVARIASVLKVEPADLLPTVFAKAA